MIEISETGLFLISLVSIIGYYGSLAFIFRHYSNKYRKEDEAKGIMPSLTIGAQLEEWHIIMFCLAFLPFIITIIAISLYT